MPTDEAETPTPCVGVCLLDMDSGLCMGCWRDIEEVSAWSLMDEKEKQTVLENIRIRKSQLN